MTGENEYLGQGFVDSWQRYPEQTAIVVDDNDYTYADLGTRSLAVKEILNSEEISNTENVGLLTGKSIGAYAGILGTLFAGKAYVPMKPDHPIERNKEILENSSVDTLLIDRAGIENLPALLREVDVSITVGTLPSVDNDQREDIEELIDSGTINIAIPPTTNNGPDTDILPDVSSKETAYILFTSGSTGRPKGVPITHQNVRSYLKHTWRTYDFNPSDRFSQFFDLTFDLSVHDMFVCWGVGGSLHVIPDENKMAPGQFINDREITVWFTVPSTAMFMSQFSQLKPNTYLELRYSFFCGEALSGRLASMWQKAAPNSMVENLYGPTEATIATARYRWQPDESIEYCENGITPIGEIFPHQQREILSRDGDIVEQGEEGELYIAGPQVFDGYIERPKANKESFAEIGGTRWYRTGDLVREDDGGRLHFISRIDNQIQIRGHRVELLEIEATIRDVVESEMVAAVGWPVEEGIAQSIQAFIVPEEEISPKEVIQECETELPDYMIPKEIHLIEEMPLNVNGKIDRKQLMTRLSKSHE
jgi:amino acid adenylation domain-containing protein